jgi:hypothetical protein
MPALALIIPPVLVFFLIKWLRLLLVKAQGVS